VPPDALGAETLRVEVLESIEAGAALEGEWRALYRASERATVFQSPEWVLGYLRHLAEGPPRIVAVRRGRALAGVVPLAIGPGGRDVWTLAGTGPSDALDLLARDADAPAVARAALGCVGARGDWSALELHELREGSALATAARSGAAGRVVADGPCSVSPTLAIPEGARALEAIVPPSWARRARRDARACERAKLSVEIASACDAREHVRAWIRLHAARWRARGEAGALAGREAFVEEVLPALVRHRDAELLALRDERGVLRASCAVFRERARAAYYLGGFDPEIARLSPLVVLIGVALERAAREGARELDFLRGAEPYKYRWGAVDRAQHRIRVER